jgi:hypothetical protein
MGTHVVCTRKASRYADVFVISDEKKGVISVAATANPGKSYNSQAFGIFVLLQQSVVAFGFQART